MLFSRFFAVLTLLPLMAMPAHAENFSKADRIAGYTSAEKVESVQNDWTITGGAGLLVVPEYEGGENYEFLPVPYVDVRYRDLFVINPFDGLRVNAIRAENFKAGAGIGYDFGRDDDDADHLRGLGDVDGSIEGQLFAEYSLGATSGEITFAQDLGEGHEGFTVDAELGHVFFLREYKTIIRPSIGTTYASDNYMQSYFGVNAGQSARSGLAQFDSEAGFKDVSADLFVRVPLSQNWSINGLGGYSRLLGDAADSPIVEDENQFMGGAFLAYEF